MICVNCGIELPKNEKEETCFCSKECLIETLESCKKEEDEFRKWYETEYFEIWRKENETKTE